MCAQGRQGGGDLTMAYRGEERDPDRNDFRDQQPHLRSDRNRDAYKRWDEMIGQVPLCTPGNRRLAQEFLDRIEAAIAARGWTPTLQNRLYRLREKWKPRAEGKDIRFEVMGNASRPPTDRERDTIRMLSVSRELKEIASGSN
jgi:hypothetical protein